MPQSNLKRNSVNILVILLGFFLPLSLFYKAQYDVNLVQSIQVPVHLILFAGSFLLTYINQKNRKQSPKGKWKWWWLTFEIIGVLGLCYSSFILTLLYLFRHGVGF